MAVSKRASGGRGDAKMSAWSDVSFPCSRRVKDLYMTVHSSGRLRGCRVLGGHF